MLKSLTINNIVLIDKAEIEFDHGLCILTGETGSGKSILLDALGLAIGFRGNSRLIGNFDEKASVVAEFQISKNSPCLDLLEQNQLLDQENPTNLRIRRQILPNATSKVFVNDLPIGVNLLAKIGETLVEIHGQDEQRGLMSSSFHLQMLDEFCGNSELLLNLQRSYQKLSEIDEKINEFSSRQQFIARETDYLSHVILELEKADVEIGEEEKLAAKRDLLAAKEKILNYLKELKIRIESANSELILGQKILLRNQSLFSNSLPQFSSDITATSDKIDSQTNELDSLISKLEEIINFINQDKTSREEIEERLFLIRNLARKFSTACDLLPQVLQDFKNKLHSFEKQEQISKELIETRKAELQNYQKIASELSKKRYQASSILAKKVEEELVFLKMPNCKFKVDLTSILSASLTEKNSSNLSRDDSKLDLNSKKLHETAANPHFSHIYGQANALNSNLRDFSNGDLRRDAQNHSLEPENQTTKPKEYFAKGFECAKFLAAINGENFDEITKVASGGELSRFMLALKVALRNFSSVPVMIFDEIDTGIGGATSQAVGKRLKMLSQNTQILVVTHQAQIASKADLHLKISKINQESSKEIFQENSQENSQKNQVKTMVVKLEGDEILQEIARMISGDEISNEALAAAKLLLSS